MKEGKVDFSSGLFAIVCSECHREHFEKHKSEVGEPRARQEDKPVRQWVLTDYPESKLNLEAISLNTPETKELCNEIGRNPQQFIKK